MAGFYRVSRKLFDIFKERKPFDNVKFGEQLGFIDAFLRKRRYHLRDRITVISLGVV